MTSQSSNIHSSWKVKTSLILLQIGVFSFIFLWDIKYNFYQFRYLIIIPFLLIIINFKNTNYNLFLKYSLLPFIILIHFFLANTSNAMNLEYRDLFGILLLFIIFYVALFFNDVIINNLDKYINSFIIIFSISFLIFFFLTDSKIILNCYNGWFFQTKFIFVENSHFAIIAIPIINYYSLVFCELKNFSNNNKIIFAFFILFLIISFLNFSTTFLVGLIITNLYLLLFYKNNLKIKILSIIFILVSFFIIFNKSQCAARSINLIKFVPHYYKESALSKYFKEVVLNKYFSIEIDPTKKEDEIYFEKVTINMSIETFLTSLRVTFKSIKDNPFGVGFNRYQDAHKKYINQLGITSLGVKKNNIYDGSSNISKIITEFGIFGIIFILAFIYTALKFKDFGSKKFFLISLISLQFLRGVGYFNGGFLLVAILYFFNYLKIREKMIKFKNLK